MVKTILILSIAGDTTTNTVMDWIRYFGSEPIRINGEDTIDVESIRITKEAVKFTLLVDGKKIESTAMDAYWYRRGELKEGNNIQPTSEVSYYLHQYVEKENQVAIDFIYSHLESLRSINGFQDNKTNKLTNLALAKKSGLKIPTETLVSKQLPQENEARKYITKGLWFGGIRLAEHGFLGTGTELLSARKATREFTLSKFQSYVKKWIEVRAFVLGKEVYAVAIFSQSNPKTTVDFRRYDRLKPNRVVPYQLPEEVKKGVCQFMREANLNSGSLDFIVTPDGDHIFLEVNPVGQFEQVSIPGGYYLEEKIAKWLVQHEG